MTDGEDICPECGYTLAERPSTKQCRSKYYRSRHICGQRHGRDNVRCELSIGECNGERKGRADARRAEDPDKYIDASDVLRALRKRHGRVSMNGGVRLEEWAFFEEVPVATGWDQQRMDAWAINLWPSRHFLTVSYEVKVDRTDLLRELRDPGKRQAALERSNQHYLATGKGLVRDGELPPECGLIEVKGRQARRVVEAPHREIGDPDWRFLASIARQAHRSRL